MYFKVDKDCIVWKLENEFTLFYLWWGLAPWVEINPPRVFEFGFGWRSWELFKIK